MSAPDEGGGVHEPGVQGVGGGGGGLLLDGEGPLGD